MTDEQMYKELTRFANDHTLAKNLRISITKHSKSYTALNERGAKYEDVCLLSDIVRGAEHYLMWKRRKK